MIDIQQLCSGNRRALAKAITLVESSLAKHRKQSQVMLNQILPKTGNSIRLGISGVPGVGKSTFIEALGLLLIEKGKKVAVLAVDPSSPVAGGCILGDKTRMEELSIKKNAFIRPSPSSGVLGGVAQKTREAILLCEAAGFDIIIIETVGVGQSEFEVGSMVDFFLLLMVPNAGDELQGIKKGILELVHALVINKADGETLELALKSRQHYQNAFHLLRKNDFWNPQVLTCSALERTFIHEVWQLVEEFIIKSQSNNMLIQKRTDQNLKWMQKLLIEEIDLRIHNNTDVAFLQKEMKKAVAEQKITPYDAALKIADKF